MQQDSLFAAAAPRPLADRLRPTCIADVVGQDHLLADNAPLARMVASRRLGSVILCGPPGTGKTTLARILARETDGEFEKISAVASGLPELRRVLESAQERRRASGRPTVLFVDEIHRWNKAQQDALLPGVEDGSIVLIGATTENVGFEINGALLSRCKVFELRRLSTDELERIAQRAEAASKRLLPLSPDARTLLLDMADGDGRYLLNLCEDLFALPPDAPPLDVDGLGLVAQRRAIASDKGGDAHHALFSALQKSVRGSDVQAALYWTARLLRGGEPPRALFRRLVVMASEEIGLADPQALPHTVAAAEAFDRVGDPEGRLALAQAVAYLATAPKSNAVYRAFGEAMDLVERTGALPPPRHIINAPTAQMRSQGYKDGYIYDHDCEHAFSGQEFFPDGLADVARPEFYRPSGRGQEREIAQRLTFWGSLRARRTPS